MAKKADWKARGELIRASMSSEQPPVKIEKVMAVLDLRSTSAAIYALNELAKIGVVKWIAGKWYLV